MTTNYNPAQCVRDRSPEQEYLYRSQNPYVALSIFEQGEDAVTVSDGHGASQPNNGISKKAFSLGCRKILLQYEPMKSGRGNLRPDFSNFITDNVDKSALSRAAILQELSRYNLEGLHPHLNRERIDEVLSKLKSIATTYPT